MKYVICADGEVVERGEADTGASYDLIVKAFCTDRGLHSDRGIKLIWL